MKLSEYLKKNVPSLTIGFFRDSPTWGKETDESKARYQQIGCLSPKLGIGQEEHQNLLKKNSCWSLFFSMQGRRQAEDASKLLQAFQFGEYLELLGRAHGHTLFFRDVEITQEDLDLFGEALQMSGTNIENDWFSSKIEDPMFADCPEAPTTCVLSSGPDEMMLAAYMLRSAARLGVKLMRSETNPDSILVFRSNSCPADPLHVLLKACELNLDKKEDLILSQFELTTEKELTRNELDQSPIYCFTDVSIIDEDLIDARRKLPVLTADKPILDWFMENIDGSLYVEELVTVTNQPNPVPSAQEPKPEPLVDVDEAVKILQSRMERCHGKPMKDEPTKKLSEYMAFEIGRLGGIVLPSGIQMYPFVVMMPMNIPVTDDPIWSWLHSGMNGFLDRTAFSKIFQAFRSLPVGYSQLPPFGNSARYLFEEVIITKQDLDSAQNDTQKIAERHGRYMRQWFAQKPTAEMKNPFMSQPSGFIPGNSLSRENITLPQSEWANHRLRINPISQFPGVSEPMKANRFSRPGMHGTKIHTLGSYLRRTLERLTSQLTIVQLRQVGTAAIVQNGALSGEILLSWPIWMRSITFSNPENRNNNPILRAFAPADHIASRSWMHSMGGNRGLVLGYFQDYAITQEDIEDARQHITQNGAPHPWLSLDLEEPELVKLDLYQYLRREVENSNTRFRVVMRVDHDQSVGVICYEYNKEDDVEASAYHWGLAVYHYRQQNRQDSVVFNLFLNGLRTKDFHNDHPKSRAEFIFLNADISQLDIVKARQVYQEVTGIPQVHPWLISDLVKGEALTGQAAVPGWFGCVPTTPTQPGLQVMSEGGWKPIPTPEWARTIREEAKDQAFPRAYVQANPQEAAKAQAIFDLAENLSHGARCVLRALKEDGATAVSTIIETNGLKALEEARFVLRFRPKGEFHVAINKDGVLALKMLKVLFPKEG